jgi:hypothetical protein
MRKNGMVGGAKASWMVVAVAMAALLVMVPAAWAAPDGATVGQTVPRTPVPTWTPVLLPAPDVDVVVWLASPDVTFISGSSFFVGMNVTLLDVNVSSARSLRIKLGTTAVRFAAENGLGQVCADGSEIVFDAAALAQLDLSNLPLNMVVAEETVPASAALESGATLARASVGAKGGLLSRPADLLPGTEIPFEVVVVLADGSEATYIAKMTLAPAVLPKTGD